MSHHDPYRVLSACQINGKLITSPNMKSIPHPPLDQHSVRVRSDQRFGDDDFTLWPQFYLSDYDYLPAMPRKPQDPSDPLAILWFDLTPEHFIPHPGSAVDGFGTLSDSKRSAFEALRVQLLARAKPHLRRSDSFSGPLFTMIKLVNHSCVRIGELSSTFQDLQFIIAEFQRYYLEVYSMLQYNEIYFDRYVRCLATGYSPPSVANTLGAFTSDAKVASILFFAGLPLYFIRENNPQLNPVLSNIVVPTNPATLLSLDDACPAHPVIFKTTGTNVDTKKKFDEMRRYSRIWMYYDPGSSSRFDGVELVPNGSHIITLQNLIASRTRSTQPHTSAKVPYTGNRSKKVPKPAAGRNPFEVVNTDLFPKPSSCWSTALAAVDQHPNQLLADHTTNASHGRYALPDPHLLFHHDNDEKSMAYMIAWLRARPSLMYQARKQLTLSQRAQTWRQFLEMLGRDSGKNTTSNAALIRSNIEAAYTFLLSESHFDLASELSPSGRTVKWRDTALSLKQKPADLLEVFREVTWELNEANFRLELFSLDCLASTLNFEPYRRIERISKCFDPDEFFPISLPVKNSGLAADEWECRVPCIVAFVEVMKSWGVAPAIFNLTLRELDGEFDEKKFKELEEAATKFYCQKFFAWFGRAASLPRRLRTFNN